MSNKMNKGFFYSVTDDQISEHKKRSVSEIFSWIENTNKFVRAIRKPEENKIAKSFTKKIFFD